MAQFSLFILFLPFDGGLRDDFKVGRGCYMTDTWSHNTGVYGMDVQSSSVYLFWFKVQGEGIFCMSGNSRVIGRDA